MDLDRQHEDRGNVPVRFLADEPADTDSFGSHDRVARAIASAIVENPDVRVIGLLGPWGSGKSTVVRLTDLALAKSSETFRVFTYDAWLHQSDPPRRAFLERFLSFLVAEGLIVSADWEEKMDVINKKLEKSTTTNTPHLTAAGRLLLLSLLLVPIGSRFLGADWFGNMIDGKGLKALAFPVGLLLTVSPALFAFGIFLSWRPLRSPLMLRAGFFGKAYWNGRPHAARWSWIPWHYEPGFIKSANWRRNRHPHEQDSVLSIVSSKHVREQSSRVVRSPEPSTIEFQTLFRELLQASEHPDQRLLIVVDNLDRLPEAEAVEMWTTIRSFFLGSIAGAEAEGKVRFPSVLLPIDPEGLARLHGKDEDEHARALLKSFMDKTFDLVFHVNGPVVSDWEAFMQDALQRTVGHEIAARWGLDVVRIYARKIEGRVTPRDLNRQVNAIAALWLQWRTASIPFPVVAYYAIHRENLDRDLAGGIANPLSRLIEYDADWEKSLAGIHFGLEPENAFQVLLSPQVRQAIDNNDRTAFSSHGRIRGFERILDDLLEDEHFGLVRQRSLAELLADGPPDPAWRLRVWQRLRRLWLASSLRDRLDADVGSDRLLDLLIRNADAAHGRKLLNELAKDIAGWSKPHVTMSTDRTEEGLSLLVKVWLLHSRELVDPPTITFSDASLYLDVVGPLYEEKDEIRLLLLEGEPDRLARTMSEQLGQQQQKEVRRKTQLTLAHGPGERGKRLLLGAALRTLRSDDAGHANTVTAAELIGGLRVDEQMTNDLSDFVKDGHLRNATENALGHWDAGFTAQMLALCILEGAEIPNAPGAGWIEFLELHPDLPQLTDGFIGMYGGHSILRLGQFVRQNRLRPFIAQLVAIRIDEGNLGQVDLPKFLEDWMLYQTIVPDDLRGRLISLVSEDPDFVPILTSMHLEHSAIAIFKILILDRHWSEHEQATARRMLGQTLSRLSVAEWTTQITEGSPLLELTSLIATTGSVVPMIGGSLFDALFGLISRLTTAGTMDAASWMAAASILDGDGRRAIFNALRDRVLDVETKTDLTAILRAGGDEFISIALTDRADESIRHFLIPILEEADGLAWAAGHADGIAVMIAAASDAVRAELHDRLSEYEHRHPESAFETLNYVRERWSVS